MTDYQRACEVVGVAHTCSSAKFIQVALMWIMDNDYEVAVWKVSDQEYAVTILSDHYGPTLTAALTAAVLAVAGEQDG